MINMSDITRAVEEMLREHTADYTIERNGARNDDPNVAALGNGWIGIRKGKKDYEAYSTGPAKYLCDLEVIVEVQYARFDDAAEAEDHIEEAVEEILGILNNHQDLDGKVSHLTGFNVTYDVNTDVDAYHYAAVITVRAQARG